MSQNSKLEQNISELAVSICVQNDCTLYDVEFNSGGRVLTIYIDKEGEASVGLEHCENVSRALSEALDEQDLIPGAEYRLEVSSPGVERKLAKKWHYDAAVGKLIEVKLFESLGRFVEEAPKKLERQKLLQGRLELVNDETFIINIDEHKLELPLAKVSKAKVMFEM